jgi:hypothetical protein
MKIVIKDEPICAYLRDNRIECEFIELPAMRAAIFKLSLQLDDMIDFANKPDTLIAKQTKKLFDETLAEHYELDV